MLTNRKLIGAVMAPIAGVIMLGQALAQEPYRLPPQEIVDIVDAPPAPFTSLSPARDTILLMHREALPPVSEMARPMERLAGMRLDAATNGRHGPRSVIGLSILDLETQETRDVRLPDDAGLSGMTWSPDGSRVAFAMTRNDEISLWVLDIRRGRAREIVGEGLNAVFTPFRWMPDGERLLVNLVDPDRGDMPERPRVPVGPVTQEASGYEAPVRTYQDLL